MQSFESYNCDYERGYYASYWVRIEEYKPMKKFTCGPFRLCVTERTNYHPTGSPWFNVEVQTKNTDGKWAKIGTITKIKPSPMTKCSLAREAARLAIDFAMNWPCLGDDPEDEPDLFAVFEAGKALGVWNSYGEDHGNLPMFVRRDEYIIAVKAV